jgi:hypothetical protein
MVWSEEGRDEQRKASFVVEVMSSSKDTDWEDVLAETPWDSDIREQLQEARMIGKEAILLANVMKQPMEQLMQVRINLKIYFFILFFFIV